MTDYQHLLLSVNKIVHNVFCHGLHSLPPCFFSIFSICLWIISDCRSRPQSVSQIVEFYALIHPPLSITICVHGSKASLPGPFQNIPLFCGHCLILSFLGSRRLQITNLQVRDKKKIKIVVCLLNWYHWKGYKQSFKMTPEPWSQGRYKSSYDFFFARRERKFWSSVYIVLHYMTCDRKQ